jgi:hypothetical protein
MRRDVGMRHAGGGCSDGDVVVGDDDDDGIDAAACGVEVDADGAAAGSGADSGAGITGGGWCSTACVAFNETFRVPNTSDATVDVVAVCGDVRTDVFVISSTAASKWNAGGGGGSDDDDSDVDDDDALLGRKKTGK